ncbi:MAG: glycosyltransferase family 4 protein [Hyphomicrobiales bacterium]|nr:glycosyltransferase family 4 protein [Hyphomicrobiales bacterium]
MATILVIASLPSSLVNFRGPLIEDMIARGHVVHAAGPACDAATAQWLRDRSVDYHAVEMARTALSPRLDVRTLQQLRAHMRAIRPDVVFAYTIKPVIYGMLAASLAGVQRRYALVTGLGYAFTDGDRSAKRRITQAIASSLYAVALRRASGVFFQNPDDAALFAKMRLLPRRIAPVIVNGSGVDVAAYAPAPLPAAPRFLMIARLVADKGVREFIAAARIVKAQRPDALFQLVGPADPNPAAISPALIPDAVADGVIEYPGAAKDVRPFIAQCSVYVLPSYREGTPRTVLEAMAMGRPVVTTDAPGCRETVADGDNGLLVPPRDAQSLAHALLRMADDGAMRARMGQRARTLCMEKYDVHKVNAAMLDAMRL